MALGENYFVVYEYPGSGYLVGLNATNELPFPNGLYGSLHVLEARMFNLMYNDYLRMVRDVYGAELRGKSGYVVPVFLEKSKAAALAANLSQRLYQVLGHRAERSLDLIEGKNPFKKFYIVA